MKACAECGFTPRNSTGGYAERAMTIHSCAKQIDKAAARRRREAREAAVDRTPKPCEHKVAAHQHGTRAAYVLDRCRCLPCTQVNSAAENERVRLKAYGRYDGYVDAGPVREHIAALTEYGIGLKTVSKISGVSTGVLSKIVYGVYARTEGPSRGRYGAGDLVRPPSARVTRRTANRLLAVEAVPANLPPRAADRERTGPARLKLRSLVALGYSMSLVGTRLGMSPANINTVINTGRPMSRGTVDKVEALYAEISMTLPPATNQRQRISVARSKRYARERGWLLPLDLEVLTDGATEPDEPDEPEDYDEAAIERRLAGDKSVRLTKAESAEVVARWRATGRSLAECERTTGLKPDRYPATREDLAS